MHEINTIVYLPIWLCIISNKNLLGGGRDVCDISPILFIRAPRSTNGTRQNMLTEILIFTGVK